MLAVDVMAVGEEPDVRIGQPERQMRERITDAEAEADFSEAVAIP
ncbi:hypothetical protein Q4543_11925 [Salipiger sp. 1_MG-2023]|nr:hypothetical protein [Salipiger sp. 1_MG-2023]MDO6586222.1 hypothetical protein [Salipiger sp. 1_MG-2023]